MTDGDASQTHVLVAGGGVAALEAVLALRELAGERVRATVLAPGPDYVDRPMTVREPFAGGRARRYDLAALVAGMGAEHVEGELAWIDPDGKVAHTTGGGTIPYDALVLALGAHATPRFPHAQTIDDRVMDETFHGLVQDIEGGYVKSVAFVVPERMAWPLPVYELALMTADRAYDTQEGVQVTLATPESAPLALFGAGVSQALRGLLDDAGIRLVLDAKVEVPALGQVIVKPGEGALVVDRVVALPQLHGPAVRGIATAAHGFIPVDPYGRVPAVQDIYAAGDAVDYPIKHGGISAQQADTVARTLAASIGVAVTPEPFRPEIHGTLLTGGRPKYFSARVGQEHGFDSQVADESTWSPPGKITARLLGPYLEQHDAAHVGREG
jgi:sulfide:quinone oxidoreductase